MEKKCKARTFGIGVVEGVNKQIYFDSYCNKALLLFEQSTPIILDYYLTLQCFEFYFNYGISNNIFLADHHYSSDDFNFFSKFIHNNWNEPVAHLIPYLQGYSQIHTDTILSVSTDNSLIIHPV